jgi:hypothetical protein
MMRPALGDRRVEGDHLDPALHGLLADGHERVRVVGGHHDAVDLLGDEAVDHRNLILGGGLGGSGVDDLHPAKLLGGFHRAVAAGVEIGVAEVLDDHRDALVGREGRTDRGERQGGADSAG